MFVWAAVVVVVVGPSIPFTVIRTYLEESPFLTPAHIHMHSVQPTSEFPSLSLRRICFFLYIGDLLLTCV
jgi:hypothetical protein